MVSGSVLMKSSVLCARVDERENSVSGQARLLVVDDEPSLQDIVATSMRFLG